MPFVTAEDGVRIHYELEGPEDGIPLVLLHGFTHNLRYWYDSGYVELLRPRFRLAILDTRGHGESDKPTSADAYDWRTLTLDVVSAMRDAGLERAHLWGYSMGGATTMSAAIYAPQRFRSLTVGGLSPYQRHTAAMVAALPFPDLWKNVGGRVGAERVAWEIVWSHLGNFGGAVQALRTTSLPRLLYAGDADIGASRGSAAFVEAHGGPYFAIPGRSHGAAFEQAAAEVVPQVTAFIDEVEAASE